MNRKQFIASATAASLISFYPKNLEARAALSKIPSIKPKKLTQGDTIALISPAGFIEKEELDESKSKLESFGFKTVAGNNVLNKTGYLAGSDKERADDVNRAFADENIKAIVCTRGGWGVARMLDLLDYDIIKRNPKIIIGYSDITALLYGIFSQTGLVCYHGPVGISTFNDYSSEIFLDILTKPYSPKYLLCADESDAATNKDYERLIIRSGEATGELVGGNLSIVVSMIGTKYDIDLSGKILFLEEVGEAPYRIDRMLTQLIQAKDLKKCSGIALGVFWKCNGGREDSGITNSFSLQEVLYDRLFPLKIPVVYGLSFGHIKNKMTLPFGIKAKLNATEQSLKLLESTVLD